MSEADEAKVLQLLLIFGLGVGDEDQARLDALLLCKKLGLLPAGEGGNGG